MTTKEQLEAIASNVWWSWNTEAMDLFRELNADALRDNLNNPYAALKAAKPDQLANPAFSEKVQGVYNAFQTYLKAASPYPDAPSTAYFCMEYGLHESLPLYAGGLGILAGDHAKAASDLGFPFTAIGLFLKDGYFTQSFNEDGLQQETYEPLDLSQHPVRRIEDAEGKPVTVTVHLAELPLKVQAWEIKLGRVRMLLLDADVPGNPQEYRSLTHRLYQNGRAVRIQQEIILGIGGVRMLRALGIDVDVYHMNEGHCAFLALELLREELEAGNVLSDESLQQAETVVREQCVFTTHTPVMAGHDRFDPGLFLEQMEGFRQEMGFSTSDLLSYGRVNPNDVQEMFTMTVLALKMSRTANGVSQLHGEVARRQWEHMYPDLSTPEVPIGAVTNGVHIPTWTSPIGQRFLNEHLSDWNNHRSDPAYWEALQQLSDAELWEYRNSLRHALVAYAKDRVKHQTLNLEETLNPDALTIGFARRFAPYKRAALLFQDVERAEALFNNPERPLQIFFAGKAHPANAEGKQLIQQLYQMSQRPAFKGKLVILENYNMEVGRMLVSGSDVWLNNPRRPYEASGTSGQKVPIHGGLNLSILDGWWPEGYNGTNGWAIGHESSADIKDPAVQDAEDVRYLHDTISQKVLPAFYERNEEGLPTRWIEQMRSAITTLPAAFSADRMVRDYIEQVYQVENTIDV